MSYERKRFSARDWVLSGASVLLFGFFPVALLLFVTHDQLSSFADDSGSYLVMARFFSPFSQAGEALDLAYRDSYLPPLFPLFLAVTGAADNLALAHLLVGITLLLAVLFFFV
jgi:hypothetical protein